ncbi:hypothetical protein BJY04DRAFT_222774 [Aspergillus karnatakaensis]|uniref:hybrid sensor histidine kinase/response regulator n=1 Tax=Aspergillus karnatakaensis TaxID=1810916 RepID=UPI003CCD9167
MEEYLSPALRQPPLPDTEKKRLRELSRFVSSTNTPYYCTVRQPSVFSEGTPEPVAPVAEEEKASGVAYLSSDITLTALTQLGAFKFGCMRSFVSLIDGENQHIISEATTTISLRDRDRHAPNDGLYLGVTTLDLIFGVCPHAVKLFSGFDVPHLQNTVNVTANSSRYIVRDFTLEDYFKERPYVTEWPYFRFYAEVPIYSPSGHILGSYCVVDNKPRSTFGEAEVTALQEVSDAIANHLENVRTVHYHRRSDLLVQGLTTFVKERPDNWNAPLISGNVSTTVAPAKNLARKGGSSSAESADPDHLPIRELSLTTDPTGGTSPLFSNREGGDYSTDATSLSVALHEPLETPPANKTVAEAPSPKNTSFFPGVSRTESSVKSTPQLNPKDSVPLSTRIANIFSHASSLLRESMDVDGVMFVDACRCNSGIVRPKGDLLDWEPLPKNADPRPRSQSSVLPTYQKEETLCDSLGLALTTFEHGDASRYAVPDSILQQLITALPQGGVLHLDGPSQSGSPGNVLVDAPDGDTNPTVSSERSQVELVAKRLALSFPQARSLLFIPLWDWNKGQWLAGTFVWTKQSDQERALGLEELHYFKVFGDSIISEIARLDWAAKEKSKFDLISSVSHELRSPLHGMLANAELLSSSPLQTDQQEIVKALETCGITLLDTMNHLLDFAKINNLTSLNQSASSVTSMVSTFDLDVLVEEVVNSVFSGMRHAAIASTPTGSPVPGSDPTDYKKDLSVVLRFENQDQWKVTSMTGAWRRIVMNILGNALKYTDSGFVEISASLLAPPLDGDSVTAHLRFADSGRGMSQEFLRNKLFSPFSQEDALSEGAGLGLSIVKQLVSFLNGSIDVKSEVGVGTQVDIFIPVQPVPNTDYTPIATPSGLVSNQLPQSETVFSLIGFNAYPELSEEPTGTLSPAAKRKICLQGFFSHLVADQPGWKVLSAESLADATGDVAIIEEKALKRLYNDESMSLVKSKPTRFVCLCEGVQTLTNDDLASRGQVVRIHQPFSPRKVMQALKSALELKPEPPQPIAMSSDARIPQPHPNTDHLNLTPHSLTIPPKLSLTTNILKPPTPPSDPPPRSENNVLIVDDNEINIKVLAKLMTKLGFSYSTATNGLIALNKYKEAPSSFKVVLMDVSMPVMDGIDATRHIRAFEREMGLSPVKLFAVTGIASSPMQQEALIAGVDEYLVKPLSLKQLGALVKGHL